MKFSQRHIGVSSSEQKYMLDYLGLDNLDSLISIILFATLEIKYLS